MASWRPGLGFRGLGVLGLGFRGLGFREKEGMPCSGPYRDSGLRNLAKAMETQVADFLAAGITPANAVVLRGCGMPAARCQKGPINFRKMARRPRLGFFRILNPKPWLFGMPGGVWERSGVAPCWGQEKKSYQRKSRFSLVRVRKGSKRMLV